MNLTCPWDPPTYLFFSSNIPPLLYYSHILSIVGALIFGAVLFFKVRKELSVKIFIVTISLFSIWILLDVLTWAANSADIVLFYWGLTIIVEVLTYAVAFYFSYVFINKRDMPFGLKLFCVGLVLPIMVYLPTHFLLPGIDIATCNANENPLINLPFSYGVEIVFSLMIVFVAFKAIIKKKMEERKQVFIFLLGILIFLVAFSSGNIVGSITDDWNLAQYGLFGMPIFIGLLTYLVVRFKTFNIKTFAAQVLVIGLAVLIGSEFFFVTTFTNQVLVGITFVLSCIGGFLLVKSVKSEIKAKENLEIANAGQENLIHVMNHQLKGYLAKGRNIFSELLDEPMYQPVTDSAKGIIKQGFESLTEGVGFIQQVLTGSSAATGKLAYAMAPLDFKVLVNEAVEKQRSAAADKGLGYEVTIADGDYPAIGDAIQLKEAVRNLIDNSIIYTQSGSVKVSLSKAAGKILFAVKDTGVGLAEDDKKRLFTQGGKGKDSLKMNTNSTGYGLAFVKGVIEAHGGRVWAESQGTGKGSQFYVELPAER
jgi:signal transduction histidine kinase